MRHQTRCLIHTTVLLSIFVAIFNAAKVEPSSAQTEGFKLYQVQLWCGDSGLPTKILSHEVTTGGTVGRPLMGTRVICIGKCAGRRTTMADAFAGLPADLSQALTAKVEAYQQEAAFAGQGEYIAKCIGTNPKPETKCEPPRPDTNPPWLNEDAPCQNRQKATYSWGQNRRNPNTVSVTISICGEVIRYSRRTWGSVRDAPGVESHDVCCDTWQNAGNTRSPCDARRDIDCDGELNETDSSPFERPYQYPRSDDFVSNSPLTPLPFWKNLHLGMPARSECKDCKWELVAVDYSCENKVWRSGQYEAIDAEYKYQATWKCPGNGQLKKVEDSSVTMEGMRCPKPPNRSWP